MVIMFLALVMILTHEIHDYMSHIDDGNIKVIVQPNGYVQKIHSSLYFC